MDSLLPLTTNNSTELWVWLGDQILRSRPMNVRILCLEVCALDVLLHMFVSASITWSLHTHPRTLPVAHSWDLVLILTDNNPTKMVYSISTIGDAPSAYKARYLLVHHSDVSSIVINDTILLAWSLALSRFSTVRLRDRAVFRTQPSCPGRPFIIQESSVQWADLQKVDLSHCTLRIAVADLKPLSSYNSRDAAPKGAFKPFFDYIQSVLHFKTRLVRSHHYNISETVLSGKADMAFFQFNLEPNMSIDVAGAYFSRITWCVPNQCQLRRTTNILWSEFSQTTWTMIVITAITMIFVLWFMAPAPGLSLSVSVMRVLAIFTSSVTKLPSGVVRWPLVGWVLGMVVLATLYQSELHSMMAAPTYVRELHNIKDLEASEMLLTCSKDTTCPMLRLRAKEDKTVAALAAKVNEIQLTTLMSPLLPAKTRIAVLTSTYLCRKYLKKMRTLNNYQLAQTMFGFYGIAPYSYLAPRLHRLYSHLEYSGIGRLWLKSTSVSCNKGWEGSKALTNNHYKSAYILLGGGFGLAAVVFVSEVVMNLCANIIRRHSKPKKRKEAFSLKENRHYKGGWVF